MTKPTIDPAGVASLLRQALTEAEEACRKLGLESAWKTFLLYYAKGQTETLAGITRETRRELKRIRQLFRSILRRLASPGLQSEVEIDRHLESLAESLPRPPAPLPTLTAHALALEPSQIADLLQLGVLGVRRPVDEVIQRLAKPDGEAWLHETLAPSELRLIGEEKSLFLGPNLPLPTLLAQKEAFKRAFSSPSTEERRIEGLLGYFCCIAVALAQHGILISDRSPRLVHEVLRDLATALPSPWNRTFFRAIERQIPPRHGRRRKGDRWKR